MDNLTKTITVFNRDEVIDCVKNIFLDDFDDAAILVRNNYMSIKLKNGSSFRITIDDELPPTIIIEIRKKYTSLEPDFKSEIYFNHNTAYIIKYLIKPKLEELWNNLKETK